MPSHLGCDGASSRPHGSEVRGNPQINHRLTGFHLNFTQWSRSSVTVHLGSRFKTCSHCPTGPTLFTVALTGADHSSSLLKPEQRSLTKQI